MDKEFIPYKQALALKELGFNEECFSAYIDNTSKLMFLSNWKSGSIHPKDFCIAPLYQQAFRWFREKYNFLGDIYIHYEEFGFQIGTIEPKIGYVSYRNSRANEGTFKTYEEAELACLDKLIEIVKNKENEKI